MPASDDKTRKVGKAAGNRGKGRAKGVPNKATANAREAIAQFVDGNAHRLEGWLDEMALDPKLGPKAAFDAFMGVVEYHVPKLARTEHVGDEGGEIKFAKIVRVIVEPGK